MLFRSVEPQIIPPRHRHQVTKPLMRHFVSDGAEHIQFLVFGRELWIDKHRPFKIKSSKEILGQIPRLIFGGVKSFVGKIPIGNPGGSNVPPLKAFPIDDDLKMIFKKAGISYN